MRFLANDVLTAVNMNINVFTRTSTSHYFGLSSFLEAVADPGFTNGRGQGRGAEVEDRGAGRCPSPEKKIDFGSQNGKFECILGTIFFTDQLFGLNAKRRLAGKKYCKTSLLGLQSKYITRGCVAYSYKID